MLWCDQLLNNILEQVVDRVSKARPYARFIAPNVVLLLIFINFIYQVVEGDTPLQIAVSAH